jgi:hypothetical protein
MSDKDDSQHALDMLNDGLEPTTRDAFARAFTLAEIPLPSELPLQPLHQELRLAIEVWHDGQAASALAGADQTSSIEHLIGRDHLALARDVKGECRIVRVG